MTTVFATPQDAESAFYQAFERADLERMMAVWAEDEEVVCVHPSGARLVGPDAVREGWRQLFRNGPSLRLVPRDHQVMRAGMVAISSVHEHIQVIGEREQRHLVIATNVYLLTGQGWKMLAHHASPSPDAPAAPAGADPAFRLH